MTDDEDDEDDKGDCYFLLCLGVYICEMCVFRVCVVCNI